MPPALNTFIRVPMSRHGIVLPNGGCGWGLHEKARHIIEHDKYDNKAAGFLGNVASESPVFPLEDARKRTRSHRTLRFVFFTMTAVTETFGTERGL